MPQLDVSTYSSQLFWLFICFSALYVFIARVTVPRIASVLGVRWERIEGTLQRAEETGLQADLVREQFEEILAQARTQANKDVMSSLKAITQTSTKRKKEIADNVLSRIKETEDRIDKRKEQAQGELREIAEIVTSSIIEKLVKSKIKPEDLVKAIDDIIVEQKVALC